HPEDGRGARERQGPSAGRHQASRRAAVQGDVRNRSRGDRRSGDRLPPLRAKDRERLEAAMIRELKSGGYRLYSRKANPSTGGRRNLGTFKTRAAAEKHERAVQFFKRH